MPACSALRSCIIASMQNVCDRAGEALARGLLALDHRHRHVVLGEVGVDAEHLHRLLDGLFVGRVRGVALLPEELGGAQEQPRAHLPAHDVRPLVDEQRQVAIALHPLRERRADDRLATSAARRAAPRARRSGRACRRASSSRWCVTTAHSFAKPSTCAASFSRNDSGMNSGKYAFEWPVSLNIAVEDALDVLPQRVAPRLDHHAAADVAVLGEVGGLDDLLVPLLVVVVAGRGDRGLHLLRLLGLAVAHRRRGIPYRPR